MRFESSEAEAEAEEALCGNAKRRPAEFLIFNLFSLFCASSEMPFSAQGMSQSIEGGEKWSIKKANGHKACSWPGLMLSLEPRKLFQFSRL
jgi:hypothetical protein